MFVIRHAGDCEKLPESNTQKYSPDKEMIPKNFANGMELICTPTTIIFSFSKMRPLLEERNWRIDTRAYNSAKINCYFRIVYNIQRNTVSFQNFSQNYKSLENVKNEIAHYPNEYAYKNCIQERDTRNVTNVTSAPNLFHHRLSVP